MAEKTPKQRRRKDRAKSYEILSAITGERNLSLQDAGTRIIVTWIIQCMTSHIFESDGIIFILFPIEILFVVATRKVSNFRNDYKEYVVRLAGCFYAQLVEGGKDISRMKRAASSLENWKEDNTILPLMF